jgi:ribonuclease BN (tRNA processing enzyme)
VRVTILGSGTLLPDDDRRSAAHLVEGDRFSVLLDCGSGTLHGLARHHLPWQGITHLALSHYHTDHIGDVAPLLWALHHGVPGGRRAPLALLGPAGLERVMAGLETAHGEWLATPGFPVNRVELERGEGWRDPERDLWFRSFPVPHTPESVAWRLDAPGGSVGYTGDTGPCPPLGEFMRGVDVLIAECALPDDAAPENHLTPATVAGIAAAAAPRKLILTHLYPELDMLRLPDLVRDRGYTGEILVGWDGLRIENRAPMSTPRDPGLPEGPST